MLPAYPTDLAPEEWQVVVDLITGKVPTPQHANHCAWAAWGYASGRFFAEKPVVMSAAESDAFNPKAYIEGRAKGQKMAGKVDWAKLLKFLSTVLPLILPFLQPAPAAVAKKA